MRSGDRFSEWVSRVIGSPLSIFLHTAGFVACFEAVFLGEARLDTMLLALTTVVSLEAIYLSLFIQSSTNRHSDQNEWQAKADHITTQRSEAYLETMLTVLEAMSEKHDTTLKALSR
jgi:low affinity Fe/Cu permease